MTFFFLNHRMYIRSDKINFFWQNENQEGHDGSIVRGLLHEGKPELLAREGEAPSEGDDLRRVEELEQRMPLQPRVLPFHGQSFPRHREVGPSHVRLR